MYCKNCRERLVNEINVCPTCGAIIDYDDGGQSFYTEAEVSRWRNAASRMTRTTFQEDRTADIIASASKTEEAFDNYKKRGGGMNRAKRRFVRNLIIIGASFIVVVLATLVTLYFVLWREKPQENKDDIDPIDEYQNPIGENGTDNRGFDEVVEIMQDHRDIVWGRETGNENPQPNPDTEDPDSDGTKEAGGHEVKPKLVWEAYNMDTKAVIENDVRITLDDEGLHIDYETTVFGKISELDISKVYLLLDGVWDPKLLNFKQEGDNVYTKEYENGVTVKIVTNSSENDPVSPKTYDDKLYIPAKSIEALLHYELDADYEIDEDIEINIASK